MPLLRGYAPSTERSLRLCGPAPQLPLWHSHRGREAVSVSRGGFRPADNWGMLLCCQFVAPGATKPVSSASAWAWPQYLPVARTVRQRDRSFPKNLLQLSSRVQGRVFCDLSSSMEEGGQPGDGSSFGEVSNKLDYALEMMGGRKMLEGLGILKKLAASEQFWNARRLLSDVMLAAGLLLCCQFVASAATKPLKAWPQYLPVAGTASCQKDPSFANNLLQLSARAQGRMFCYVNAPYLQTGSQPVDESSIDTGRSKLKHSLGKINRTPSFGLKVQKETTTMLEGLSILEKFAKDLDYFCDHYNAHDVFFTVLAVNNNLHSHGLSNAEEISLKEKSLKIALLLLQNASVEIRTKLCSEIASNEKVKASLERIVRDRSGGADELRKLAEMILAKLPPSSTHK